MVARRTHIPSIFVTASHYVLQWTWAESLVLLYHRGRIRSHSIVLIGLNGLTGLVTSQIPILLLAETVSLTVLTWCHPAIWICLVLHLHAIAVSIDTTGSSLIEVRKTDNLIGISALSLRAHVLLFNDWRRSRVIETMTIVSGDMVHCITPMHRSVWYCLIIYLLVSICGCLTDTSEHACWIPCHGLWDLILRIAYSLVLLSLFLDQYLWMQICILGNHRVWWPIIVLRWSTCRLKRHILPTLHTCVRFQCTHIVLSTIYGDGWVWDLVGARCWPAQAFRVLLGHYFSGSWLISKIDSVSGSNRNGRVVYVTYGALGWLNTISIEFKILPVLVLLDLPNALVHWYVVAHHVTLWCSMLIVPYCCSIMRVNSQMTGVLTWAIPAIKLLAINRLMIRTSIELLLLLWCLLCLTIICHYP